MSIFDSLANLFQGQSPTTSLSNGESISWNAPSNSFLAPIANAVRPYSQQISNGLSSFNQVLQNSDPAQAQPLNRNNNSFLGNLASFVNSPPSASASRQQLAQLESASPAYRGAYSDMLRGYAAPDAGLNTQIKQEQLKAYQDPLSNPETKLNYQLKQQEIDLARAKQQAELDTQQRRQSIISGGLANYGITPTGINPNAEQPLSVRNNNPLNMRPAGSSSGFQQFSNPQAGIDAATKDLTAKISGNSPAMAARFGKGYTPNLSNLITTWAPPSENDTQNYIDFVAKKTGINPNQVLTTADIPKLLPAMAQMEGGSGALASFGLQGAQPAQPTQQAPQPAQQEQLPSYLSELGIAAINDPSLQDNYYSALATYEQGKQKKQSEEQKPLTKEGQLQRDYERGLVSKDVYEGQVKKASAETKKAEKEAKETDDAKSKLDDLLQKMSDDLDELDKKGGIVNTEKNAFMNIGRRIASSDDVAAGWLPSGQGVGQAFGTEEQTIRDKIKSRRMQVARAVKKATGMSSQEMNSNMELQTFLNSMGDLGSSYQANKEIIRSLSDMYGSGKLSKETTNAQGGWSIKVKGE